MRVHIGVGALLVALVLAGCGHGGHPAAPPPPPSAPPSSASVAGSGPLPPAADGTNLDACKDGTCQVQVTAPARFEVRGVKTSVTVSGGQVTIEQTDDSTGSSSQVTVSGPSGTSTVASDQGQVTVSLRGVSGNQVVLDISSS